MQMQRKHPQGHDTWGTPEPREDGNDIIDLSTKLKKAMKDLHPLVGVGPRGMKSAYIKALVEGNFQNTRAKEAAETFERLGVLYLGGGMPPWLTRALGGGLLTALAKEELPPAESPDSADARPTKAEDTDTASWCRALQRRLTDAVRVVVSLQQLSVGVPGGCEIFVPGSRQSWRPRSILWQQ